MGERIASDSTIEVLPNNKIKFTNVGLAHFDTFDAVGALHYDYAVNGDTITFGDAHRNYIMNGAEHNVMFSGSVSTSSSTGRVTITLVLRYLVYADDTRETVLAQGCTETLTFTKAE